ncbi:PspC domain-containing protein [Arthrobacter yangruifuii]|uniref:PspC domain-containing protein n=1 Tax=Arthrobacter yangruifuii TaxID=2606616 RepID=A0A5N6MU08_9MICC|nr:PspC domain-containing protein [Arthrobacter yangruifuii]KAD4060303.1 PspC domain-containing protein [Arthrobacter yangruifuii]
MNPSPASDSGPERPAAAAEQHPAAGAAHPASPGGPASGTAASGTAASGTPHNGFFDWIRSFGIIRGHERWFGGVASGLAARTGLDPVLIRGLFMVLGVFGIGFLLYGAAWALLPEPDGRIHAEEAIRGNWTSGMTGALVLVVLGTGGPGVSFLGADSWLGATVWTLFWVAAGVGAIYWFSTPKGRAHLRHFTSGRTGGSADPAAAATPGDTGSPGGPAAGGAPAPGNPPVTLAKTGLPSADGSAAPVSAAPRYEMSAPSGTSAAPEPAAPSGTAKRKGSGGSAKVPGAPGAYLAALFGAALLTGGAILALDYVHILNPAAPLSVALAATAVVLGLGVVILGLAGRRSGGVGSAAVAALVISFLAQPGMTHSNLAVMSNGDWSPRDAGQASGGYTAIAGNGTVDLRGTDASGDYEVPVSMAAGNISILVPDDSPVIVRFSAVAGNVETNDGTDSRNYSGLWQASDEHTLNKDADGERITIDVRSVAGNVLVTTEESDL